MKTNSRLATSVSSEALILSTFPILAHAAERSLLAVDPQTLPWYTWLWVVGLSTAGWFASSAPTLAGWLDDGGQESKRDLWTRRWGIIGRGAVCVVAGFACFFGGLIIGTPMVANFLAVLFASYGGDKYMQMQAEKISNRNPSGGQQP